ncbi:sister chromatid cohesion protein 1 [Coemansia interrupta]|uniref:Sister chromatid cohesion protein 1 n=1 Tax=Coemansia interrupta TaxID=1126814 RepID=A0A9W8LG54_9FUNG|nr:sister chromatid cohesion protein 1 [Coemansia interrupta]
MFYAEAILSKKGPLAKVWLAAHLERKLTKAQLLQANIPGSVGAIIGQDQGPPLALRLSGQLLLGVSRIYARKARYLLEDCNDALIRIKMAFRPGAADITSDNMVAAQNAITLPEALTEFDVLLPTSSRMFGANRGIMAMDMGTNPSTDMAAAAALNTSRIQDITLAEQSFDVSMVARGAGGAGFGEIDLLGRDDDFRLDLDDDFVFSPPPQQMPEPVLGLDASALEPEIGRDAMQGLDASLAGARPEDISLLGKGIDGLDVQGGAMDITREDLGAGLDDGDVLRFGNDDNDLAMVSGFGDASMVPNTQEIALQEAEAEVLAARPQVDRPLKRRRLNLSDLVTSETTSLTPEEIRERMDNPADIVRVPTYLPSTRSARLEDMSSAAVAMRFLSSDSGAPFASLFAVPSSEYELAQGAQGILRDDELETSMFSTGGIQNDVPGSVVPEYLGEDNEFRLNLGDDIGFGEGLDMPGQQLDAAELLANKTFEQLEQLEEESFQRQAEEQHQAGNGISIFADTLPVRDEDISLRVSQVEGSGGQSGLSSGRMPGDSVEGEENDDATSGAGFSKNTIRAIHLLDEACRNQNIPVSDAVSAASTDESDTTLSYMGVAKDARRSDAVKLFFELLVLKTKDFVDVAQPQPFDDIRIAPRSKLRQAADSITIRREVSLI